jgi:putative tryptophan/tyrosine transport system substrate-binding protein
VRRRDFMSFLTGGAVASPLVALAQVSAAPVIGFLSGQSPEPGLLAKFRQGLSESGYFEDRNIRIEYRWAHNQNGQLSALADELVQRRVALIATTGGMAAAEAAEEAITKAARGGSPTIPIVFISGLYPVKKGFVESLNLPGHNVTGIYQPTFEVVSKRLELLQQIAAKTGKIAYLMDDNSAGQQEEQRRMADELGLVVHNARTASEIEAAFVSASQEQRDGMVVASHPFFLSQRTLIVALAARYALPAIYARREFAEAGGLMSYGPSIPESWRDMGRYTARILKGAQPKDLPVLVQDKFELLINRTTAETLGLTIPRLLRALADQVIE